MKAGFLNQAIMARVRSDAGGALMARLGRAAGAEGLYAGETAPKDAPHPHVNFFPIGTGGLTRTSPIENGNIYEEQLVQFTVHALTLREVFEVMEELKVLFSDWSGEVELDGEQAGRIITVDRQGPGNWGQDPEEGWDGYMDFRFRWIQF